MVSDVPFGHAPNTHNTNVFAFFRNAELTSKTLRILMFSCYFRGPTAEMLQNDQFSTVFIRFCERGFALSQNLVFLMVFYSLRTARIHVMKH